LNSGFDGSRKIPEQEVQGANKEAALSAAEVMKQQEKRQPRPKTKPIHNIRKPKAQLTKENLPVLPKNSRIV